MNTSEVDLDALKEAHNVSGTARDDLADIRATQTILDALPGVIAELERLRNENDLLKASLFFRQAMP